MTTSRSEADTEILRIEHLSKSFPGVRALDDISFSVHKGEIHALIGENGAGKSTVMKILAGIHQRDAGTISLGGQPIVPKNPAEAQRFGISAVYQELSLARNLTVAENIFVGREPTRFNLIRWRELHRRAAALLGAFDVKVSTGALVGTLSIGMQQIVEIARALSFEPKVLLLDEPTSSLEQHEVEQLFQLLRDLSSRGTSVIYITHKLKEVFRVASRVTVLRDGKHVGTKLVSSTSMDEIVRMMVGRDLKLLYPEKGKRRSSELLRVEQLSVQGTLDDVSFALYKGEILGMAGLVGAGRSELSRAIFGHLRKDAGRILVDRREIRIESPAHALRNGIAYLPEDRKEAGMFHKMSVADNLVCVTLRQYSTAGIVRPRAVRSAAARMLESFRIRTPSSHLPVALLSGGNQQKVLIARWLETRPRILIADEPTRGIDIGAKAEIHALLRQLCDQGIGIIIVSSELPEILGMCDRILVFHEGRLAGELSSAAASEEAIMKLATGHAA